jgi:hypothetical protein
MDAEYCVKEVMNTPKRAWAIISAFSMLLGAGAGSGTVYVVARTDPQMTRPDPFTGSQGKQLELRIQELEEDIADIKTRLLIEERFRRNHP